VILHYASLFVVSFLAATVLPLSSELALGALVLARQQLWLPVVVATAGNYLGACTTYWLGRRAARALSGRSRVSAGDTAARRAAWRLMRRYGQITLLLSWVPVLGDGLVALAGGMGVRFGAFSFWVALGKGMRYLAVGWAALAA